MRTPLRTKRKAKQKIAQSYALAAPFRGLNTRDPLAAMEEGYASLLENFWVQGVRVESRLGSIDHVTGFASPVKTLMTYEGVAGSPELWASTDDGVFAATSAGAVGAAAIARTQGWCRYVQFRNSAGTFLFSVNGTDDLAYYDGTTWATTASFTIGAGSGGGTLNSNDLTAVEVHQRRLWFIEKDTADAWYLGVDLIGGDINRFRIGAQFSDGGYLLALATWSLDSGTGPEDLLAFISSKGQVAVYAGTDPTSTADWGLRGVYRLAEPVGPRPVTKVGGDLWIMTSAGVYSMNTVLSGRDRSALRPATDVIAPTFNDAVRSYGSFLGWQFQAYAAENMLLINAPTVSESAATQFALNLRNGAWTVFTGWNALCFEVRAKELYFGSATKVIKAWSGYDDNGASIMAKCRQAYSTFGLAGQEKHWKQARANLTIAGDAAISIGMDTDFKSNLLYSPAGLYNFAGDAFDAGVWNTAKWGGLETGARDWATVLAWPAIYGAFRLRSISSGGRVSWTATDFTFEAGV